MSFLKYLFAGLLGLSLQVVFPDFKIDWLVIVLAYAILSQNFFLSLLLILVLSLCYSHFSLVPAWQWPLPYLIAWGAFRFFPKNFSLTPRLTLSLLILFLWSFDRVFWEFHSLFFGQGFFFSLGDAVWGLATLLMGVYLLPTLFLLIRRMFAGLLRSRSGLGELPRYQASFKKGRLEVSRKPFGFNEEF